MSGPARRSQQERSAATRARVLDATLASLLERGYAATTLAEVQSRAEVARGTLLHHFPTRASLLVAVVEDVADRRLQVLRGEDDGLRTGWDAAVDVVRRDLEAPVFRAVLELWVAARTDDELREVLVPVERVVFEAVHAAVSDLVGRDDPRGPTLVQFTIDLLTGSVMTGLLDERHGGHDVLVARWRRAIDVLLGERPADGWL